MPRGMGAASTGACGLGGRTGGGFCAQLGEGAKTTATEKRAMQIRKLLISRLLVCSTEVGRRNFQAGSILWLYYGCKFSLGEGNAFLSPGERYQIKEPF